MNTSNIVKCASLLIALSMICGCACSTHCSRGEPMARAAVELRDVHFAFDSAQLTPTAKKTLREDYENLGIGDAALTATILLEGRADERGQTAYNQKLSERRVTEVRNFLLKLGAKESQFSERELGETAPIDKGSTPDAWAKNRSVRVLVR